MRENMGLYRGKRKDTGEWVEGNLFENDNGNYPMVLIGYIIMSRDKHFQQDLNFDGYDLVEVDSETVGQFTGLTDLHGKKIFEGDIIKIRFESDSFTHPAEPIVWYDIAKVFWSSEHFGWYAAFASGEELSLWEYDDPDDVEIVGNIHDNPELEVSK